MPVSGLLVISPLLRRILLVNAMPLVLLVAALLYLDEYQSGLLQAEVSALREQARVYAGAIGQAAVEEKDLDNPRLVRELARPLLHRLTEPTPDADAKIYMPDGTLIADSRVDEGPSGDVEAEPLAPPTPKRVLSQTIGRAFDWLFSELPHAPETAIALVPSGADDPDALSLRPGNPLQTADANQEMPPYIRQASGNRLLVTVAEPIERSRHVVGIVLLTRNAREVQRSLLQVRLSILGLFGLALVLTVVVSWYLASTIARPILRLADSAQAMQGGRERSRDTLPATPSVPPALLARQDEIGKLAVAFSDSAKALWARMDSIERFAADVAHEIKNPLSSIRSAVETLQRVDDKTSQARLLGIVAADVKRLDRLISDISDASRIDAELSRTAPHDFDIVPLLCSLEEIYAATRHEGTPRVVLEIKDQPLIVRGVEDRLVQVLRNLIGNAMSFSPPGGTIFLRAQQIGSLVELTVDDEGPGIPEAKLEHIFDRFYSERPSSEGFGQHSGLGLSISRQIVEALNGRISAENRRDHAGATIGARLVVRLPQGAAAH